MIRSYKAKFRAGVARTPAERAAVNWTSVIADATNGITADFMVQRKRDERVEHFRYQSAHQTSGWSQMTPFILGMADTTGAYDTWLQQALTARTPFLLRTPDKRFPSGETRAIQTAVTGTSKAGPAAGSILYFRNRPEGEDTPSDPWGTWYYDNQRFWGIAKAGGNGPFTVFTVAENDMLAAEGYIRTGQFAAGCSPHRQDSRALGTTVGGGAYDRVGKWYRAEAPAFRECRSRLLSTRLPAVTFSRQ